MQLWLTGGTCTRFWQVHSLLVSYFTVGQTMEPRAGNDPARAGYKPALTPGLRGVMELPPRVARGTSCLPSRRSIYTNSGSPNLELLARLELAHANLRGWGAASRTPVAWRAQPDSNRRPSA